MSVNYIEKANLEARDDAETQETVTAWLRAFGQALASGDEAVVASLFEDDGNWRDVLAFTWHLTPAVGAKDIAKGLVAGPPAGEAHGGEISPNREPPRRGKSEGREWVE